MVFNLPLCFPHMLNSSQSQERDGVNLANPTCFAERQPASGLEPAVCQGLRADSLPLLSDRAARSAPRLISMTKHWGGQSMLAPPALYLRSPSLVGHQDHQLDFQIHPLSNTARSSPAQHLPFFPIQAPVQQSPLLEKPAPDQFSLASAPMDNATPLDQEQSWDEEKNAKSGKKNAKSGKKKNYQRYPKPPYSYLAMITMVIQNSPEKKLTLSEILKEISTLFPFFEGNYKGWRDSVRHNLSSYDCFVKVLKDPGKPQGKGNFWAVEESLVPLELLKRQNTAVSRQDETIFAQDLAPYILHGHQHKPDAEPPAPPPPVTVLPPGPPVTALLPFPTRQHSSLQEELYRPKLDSSFAIDSLLHSLRPASAAGEPGRDCWGVELHTRPHPRHSSTARSASASSASPASSSSDEDWRGVSQGGKRVPEGEAGSDGYEDCRLPPHKSARRVSAPPWELPTSYAKYTPPNAVAPPSMRFNGGPLIPLGMPLYGYGGSPVTSSHFVGHAYWPLLPSGRPPLIMDLDAMLQSVPPNKSVFDVLGPPNQSSHQPAGQYTLQSGPPLRRHPHY
ncbi:forkhead box protein H1 isoform X1 [Oncorhynchus mykiss]|uniref:forkhead box protein H1 isoform X1 n=1 Tax=Oncorhynchus mykiss TaxID=8022 RepID=UPI0018782AF5|nr:forkhead box protein H1 isoform X1 [Oncorhynchus mykiss]